MLMLFANLFAWYAMTNWLQNFAYRIEISWPREIEIIEFLKMLVQDPVYGFYFFFTDIFISRGWWMFALAGGLALTIAFADGKLAGDSGGDGKSGGESTI